MPKGTSEGDKMTTEKKNGHGGARPGSGPKKKYEKGRKASAALMIYMTDDEKKKLENEVERRKTTKTEFVKLAIAQAIERQ